MRVENSFNCWKLFAISTVAKTISSQAPKGGRFNDYPEREYTVSV
jgi:hypothetical protein